MVAELPVNVRQVSMDGCEPGNDRNVGGNAFCRRMASLMVSWFRANCSAQVVRADLAFRRGARRPASSIASLRDRKSGVKGRSGSVRVDLGGRRIIKKNKQT